jgi:hypothetical protein
MKNYRGKYDPSKGVINYGKYERTEEEFEAYRWCINNGIIIWPETKLGTEWKIEIRINGKTSKSPEAYPAVEVWKKMYEFYLYYYNKYENKV